METLDFINSKIFSKIQWDAIDKELALKNPKALDLLREACLVECFLPVYTGKMNELFWDNIEATSIFTIEAFEAYGHYYTLRKYLDIVGYNPVTDQDVQAVRNKGKDKVLTDKVKELVNFMGTEHFASAFFRDMEQMIEEPVLKSLLPRYIAEEESHSQCAFDLLQQMIEEDPAVKEHIRQCVLEFKHIGAYVTPYVSPATDNNIKTILSFNQKIERLIGQSISDIIIENQHV